MQLTVYKASAGSGKTYTLTREYLKQALKHANNPYVFKSILAVTFTNKATEEMKSRIVLTLNELVHNKNPNLSRELQAEFNISAHELQERAQKVRTAILHDYTYFAVSTIDAFFQRIIHAFVREAGLRPGFNLELDTKRLLDEAIDELMLSASNDESLRRWLFSLIENRIENRTSWDMRPMLMDIGQKVFDEQYRRYGTDFHAKTGDREFMENYARDIYTISSAFEAKMTAISQQAIDCIDKSGLTIADFKYGKSGFINYFYKIKQGEYAAPSTRVFDALNSIDAWATKTSKRKTEIEAVYSILHPLLKESIDYWDTHSQKYYTAFEILKKLRELGVLADIAKNVRNIASNENLMPISDSVHLLSTLINDSDTPFVYERTGNRYKTFMIDEFQDTSVSQWNNFRPLLHNSLAEGQFSMVVGDIKQSIYRWRNGDWRILARYLDHDFSQFGLIHQTLDTNWRSKAVIVQFNNAVFENLSKYMQTLFTNEMESNTTGLTPADIALLNQIILLAYTDASQQVSPKTKGNEGYVSIDVFESDDDDEDSSEKVLINLPKTIIDLQNRGYHANDIAILVRSQRDGQAVANCLLEYKKEITDKKYCFDVISQDSLFIANAQVVQIIIAALRIATNPDDLINAAFLSYATSKHVNTSSYHNSFTNKLDEDEMLFINQLLNQSLTEAFELLVQHYQLNTNVNELPFLQELHDIVANFSNRKLSDISSFLEWWDDKGHTSTLSPGQKQNAINILTIHKSKGLQYPVVIVPFANWSIEPRRQTTMWFAPKNEPFNSLPFVPVVYGKDLQKTDFNPDYLSEKVQSYIDNINLLYVAFTRAESELYICLPQNKRDGGSRVSSLLNNFFKQFSGVSETFSFGELEGRQTESNFKIEFGERQVYSIAKEAAQGLILQNYPSNKLKRKLRLKYESIDYFGDTPTLPLQRRNYGILMHQVFANIHSANECSQAIDALLQDGLIDDEGKTILTEKIERALQNEIAKTWFDGTWTVKNEASLLIPHSLNSSSTFIQRPDRVMIKDNETLVIDYKFGIVENKQHEKQLSEYLNLLSQMNYPNVKGYIWYVHLDKVISI